MLGYFVICLLIILQGCAKPISKGEIKGKLIEVLNNVHTYSYEMEMEIETSVAGEDIKNVVKANAQADIDVKNRKMKIFIHTNERNKRSKSTQTKIYILDTMEYIQSEEDSEWIKFEVSKHKLDSKNQIKRQMNLITGSEIKKVESNALGNIDCYLLSIEPDKQSFWEVIMEQDEEHPLMRLLNLDYEDVVKRINMEIWIEKRTFFPLKCVMKMQAVIEKQVMKQPFKLTIAIKKTYYYYNYNRPLAIKLPPQAKKAKIYQEGWED